MNLLCARICHDRGGGGADYFNFMVTGLNVEDSPLVYYGIDVSIDSPSLYKLNLETQRDTVQISIKIVQPHLRREPTRQSAGTRLPPSLHPSYQF